MLYRFSEGIKIISLVCMVQKGQLILTATHVYCISDTMGVLSVLYVPTTEKYY